jgi:hypothetical protein
LANLYQLRQKQERLKREISENLDFLIGSISSSGPARKGRHLTCKDANQVTKSRYIRKGLLPTVKRMTAKHKKLKKLLQELADVNWEILKIEDSR